MDLITIFLIAIGLCFDTFAVSVSCGLMQKEITFFNAIKIALTLAFFQALMPFLGWVLGSEVKNIVVAIDHWVAFAMLFAIGAKMIYESLKKEKEEKSFDPLNPKILIWISIATSIDAFVIGISFGFIGTTILLPVLIIGFVTYVVAMLGMFFGKKTGSAFGKKMEIIGGLILIGIGTKIMIQHVLLG